MKALRIFSFGLTLLLLLTGCYGNPQPPTEPMSTTPVLTEPPSTEAPNTEPPATAPQVFTGETPITPYHCYKNKGSLQELTGDIVLLSIFINEPGQEFTPQQEQDMLDNLDLAARWLETEAAKYGAEARIYTGKEDDTLVLHYTSAESLGGYKADILPETDIFSCYQKATQKYGTWQIGVMIFANEDGRSSAGCTSVTIPIETLESAKSAEDIPSFYDYLEYSQIYRTYFGEPEPYLVCAHEILHDFGAIDLYYEYLDPERMEMDLEKSSLMVAYAPFEIMRSGRTPEFDFVGELTAYLVGWTETVPAKYAYFLYY